MNGIPMSRWRVALNTRLLDDAMRESTLTSIQKVAPQSSLIQVPAIAASLAALGTKGTALATNVAAVAANTKVLRASTTQRDLSRAAFDLELSTLAALTQNNATSAADITAMGFSLLPEIVGKRTPPEPPAALLVTIGRSHGKATVSVAARGYQGKFAAEVSPDPIGVWTVLPGSGKSRKLSGYASGTKLWVHFAAERFGVQSAWSTPVLVIIP